MHYLYLHGFTSSAQSSKAIFIKEKLAERGATLISPDFNEPDFSTLTITRMIEQVRAVIRGLPDGPVTLIGSSLGGFVAVQVAVEEPERIRRLVLLAPALDFSGDRLDGLGDRTVKEWRRSGSLNVFHHALGRTLPVHFDLYLDAEKYDSFNARLDIPVVVYQGRRDTAVDPRRVEEWARARPNVDLHLLDDDHQLHSSLDEIWRGIASA